MSSLSSLAIKTSQILAKAQGRDTSYAAVLAHGGLHRSFSQDPRGGHMHGVPFLALAWALLTKHLGHGFSSGFGVQDECPSHTS